MHGSILLASVTVIGNVVMKETVTPLLLAYTYSVIMLWDTGKRYSTAILQEAYSAINHSYLEISAKVRLFTFISCWIMDSQ